MPPKPFTKRRLTPERKAQKAKNKTLKARADCKAEGRVPFTTKSGKTGCRKRPSVKYTLDDLQKMASKHGISTSRGNKANSYTTLRAKLVKAGHITKRIHRTKAEKAD